RSITFCSLSLYAGEPALCSGSFRTKVSELSDLPSNSEESSFPAASDWDPGTSQPPPLSRGVSLLKPYPPNAANMIQKTTTTHRTLYSAFPHPRNKPCMSPTAPQTN